MNIQAVLSYFINPNNSREVISLLSISTKSHTLANKVTMADTFLSRFKGLMGKRAIPPDTALVIRPCNQVHMCFMRFSIGAIFVDHHGQVLHKQRLNPWQISKKVSGANAVIELDPEQLEQVKIGEQLEFRHSLGDW